MTAQPSEVVETARAYYNSSDADAFYYRVWGGEDIHIGLYSTDQEPIRTASRRTVATMAARTANFIQWRPGIKISHIPA